MIYLERTQEISSSKMKCDMHGKGYADNETKLDHADIETNPK